MSLQRAFLHLMTQVVEIFHSLGEDFEGNPIYETTSHKYRCRISGKGLALRRQFSEDQTVIYDIWLDPTPIGGGAQGAFTLNDKVVLPDSPAYLDRTPELFSVGEFPTEKGRHHVKLQCGWMYHRQGQ